jgi:uncharacterized protein YegL
LNIFAFHTKIINSNCKLTQINLIVRNHFMSELNFTEQMPFNLGTDNFADNPEQRCPCILLLDTSGSMAGAPIEQLNSGLADFKSDLMADSVAIKRVDVAVVTFGPVKIENTFHTAPNFFPPVFSANGDTPMGAAIKQGLEMLRQRKNVYRSNGIPYNRPWVILITDGAPTDEWRSAAASIKEGEDSKAFVFFAVGVEGADMNILRQISVNRDPLKLQGLKFREFFKWLSDSMGGVSRSTPGTTISLPSPRGWAEV